MPVEAFSSCLGVILSSHWGHLSLNHLPQILFQNFFIPRYFSWVRVLNVTKAGSSSHQGVTGTAFELYRYIYRNAAFLLLPQHPLSPPSPPPSPPPSLRPCPTICVRDWRQWKWAEHPQLVHLLWWQIPVIHLHVRGGSAAFPHTRYVCHVLWAYTYEVQGKLMR